MSQPESSNAALPEQLLASQREASALREQVEALLRENQRLSQQLQLLLNRSFGRSSEQIDPDQLSLFETSEKKVPREVPAPKPAAKKKSGHGRKPFPDSVPRRTIVCELPKEDCVCGTCGEQMALIGVDVVERGDVIPAQVIVNHYKQSKYACPKGHEVKTASAPSPLIDRCKIEISGYAAIVTSKFVDHNPLARQEAMWKRRGMPIARSTMCDMVLRVAELFEPIVNQMRREILAARVLHADETPIQVQVEGQKGTKTGYMWVYVAGDRVAFDFTMGRGRDGPIRFLKDFDGALVTDAYAGYDEVERKNGITRIGCWAHARRRFKEARDVQGEIADEALFLIARLYRVERFVDAMAEKRELDGEEHRALRAEVRKRLSRRVIARLDRVGRDLENQRSVLPKSAIGKAVRYLGGQWDRLTRFLDDPDIPLDNNVAERALRAVAIGRKNYLFAGSERGGHAAATHYAVAASCKVLDIDPMVYIEDVLKRVSTTPAAAVAALTPWAWAQARRSD